MLDNCIKAVKEGGLILVSVPNFLCKNHLRTYSSKSAEELCSKHFNVIEVRTFKDGKNERYSIYGTK